MAVPTGRNSSLYLEVIKNITPKRCHLKRKYEKEEKGGKNLKKGRKSTDKAKMVI
jgi:hypothetical protein